MQSGFAARELRDILALERLSHVVDIGANPIDSAPPYKNMLADGLCRITGFEPQQSALDLLNRNKGSYETYLPCVVGDGSTQTLNVCRYSGLTSTLEPDLKALEIFALFKKGAEVTEKMRVHTRRLDDIAEVVDIDFLKIDIQGGELAVFRNAVEKLRNAVVIQTEISFVTLYERQPPWGVVDGELRAQGFVPFCFEAIKPYDVSAVTIDNRQLSGAKQLLEADLVYVRNYMEPGRLRSEQLKHLCLIMHHCYAAYDLSLRCMMQLQERGAVLPGSVQRYADLLAAGGALRSTP